MLNLIYFYSDSCSSCRDYIKTVQHLSLLFHFDDFKSVNIDDGPVAYDLRGVPTVIIESDRGVVFELTGSYPLSYLRKYVKSALDGVQ